MALTCPGIITRDRCGRFSQTRYSAGRSGYTGAPSVKAIVLHRLKGISAEAYDNSLSAPLPRFQCAVPSPSLCQEFPSTPNPKSVHFLVTQSSLVQYVEVTNTAFGIDYLLGSTWPGLSALMPITDVNGPFIHVAVDGECSNSLIVLLCCIGTELGQSLPIISASDLQADRLEFLLSPSLQTQVDDCVASGGFQEPPTVADLEDRIEQLEECCASNTSDIITLKEDVQLLNGRVAVLEQRVNGHDNQIAFLLEQVAIIPTLVAQITTIINQIIDIQGRCCPADVDSDCFRYQLLPGDEMVVTPNQCVWLNLPTKLEDRDGANCGNNCQGPIVKPGPLWMAELLDCTWQLEATVRFRLSQWCVGKKASLYLVACGKKYLIAEQTIATTGTQAVTLHGTFLLPPGCTDVHLLVCTNDDKIVSGHVVEFADFKGCCA